MAIEAGIGKAGLGAITAPSIGGKSAAAGATGSSKGSFADLVKGVAKESVDTSRAADAATNAAASGQINDLELVQVMTEAEISLQRFKTVYETTKQSLDKILNMPI